MMIIGSNQQEIIGLLAGMELVVAKSNHDKFFVRNAENTSVNMEATLGFTAEELPQVKSLLAASMCYELIDEQAQQLQCLKNKMLSRTFAIGHAH